jgi:hypothetical protein
MVQFLNITPLQKPNALLDFSEIGRALGDYAERERLQSEREQGANALMQLYGSNDEAMRNALANPASSDMASSLLKTQYARNHPAPLSEADRLDLDYKRAQIGRLNREAADDGLKTYSVDGRLVQVGKDGTAKEIYAAPQRSEDTSKTYMVDGRLVQVGRDGTAKEIYAAPKNTEQTATGPYKDMAEKARVEAGLRDEIAGANKRYAIIRDAEAKIAAIGQQPSAASDLALIFSFMKVLDPESVVRESEFANAQNAAGVPDQVRNLWNRALSGERLNDAQRADFMKQAQTLALAQRGQYERSLRQYEGLAKRLQLDPENVVLDHGSRKAFEDARAAIAAGADPQKVRQRLIENGFDPAGL